MIQRCFLASVFRRLQQNRAAASCAAGRRYPDQTCAPSKPLRLPRASSAPGEPSFERPQASWGPLPPRFRAAQAGIVDNGRHQEDPVVRWPGKHAYTDAISRNVLTRLQADFRRMAFDSQ